MVEYFLSLPRHRAISPESEERPRVQGHGGSRICVKVWAITFNDGEISLADLPCIRQLGLETAHPPLHPVTIWSRTVDLTDFNITSDCTGVRAEKSRDIFISGFFYIGIFLYRWFHGCCTNYPGSSKRTDIDESDLFAA